MDKKLFNTNDNIAIPGLQYIANYITQDEQEGLIKAIDNQTWLTDLKRRVQHYGYKYDYKKRKVDQSMYLGNLPNWISVIANKLYKNKLFDVIPDQAIINEYNPGQGIAKHIDCVPCFSDTIASLSLGSSCMMEFKNINTLEKTSIFLEPRSLIIFQRQARFEWEHGIPARKNDLLDDEKFARDRRISVIFRKVII